MTKINWTKDKIRRQMTESARLDLEERRNHHIDSLTSQLSSNSDTVSSPSLTNREMKTTVMTVTPALAARWLEGNTHNRALRQGDVEKWSRVMRSGGWRLNGESIIFDNIGRLQDGQHRLWACVESDTPFDSVVVFGSDPEAFTTIDQGRHRSPGDHLVVSGVASRSSTPQIIAAAATLLHRYRSNSVFSKDQVMPEILIHILRTEPQLADWVLRARRAQRGLTGFATPIAVSLHIGSGKFPEQAELFLSRWVSGTDLQHGSPILALRMRVMNKPPRHHWERLFLAASAWNAFVKGRDLMKMGSMRGDNFPKIEGDASDTK